LYIFKQLGKGTNEMTLIIGSDGVENTASTEVTIGGKVKVGTDFKNAGLVKIFPGGELEVNKDLINEGSLIINDPERLKQFIIEAVKAAGSVAELGTKILTLFKS